MYFKISANGSDAGTFSEHKSGFNILTLNQFDQEVIDQAHKIVNLRKREKLLIHIENDTKISNPEILLKHDLLKENKIVLATNDEALTKVIENQVVLVTKSVTYGTGYVDRM